MGALVCRGALGDLNALNLSRVQLVQREAGWRWVAIEQHLGVASAQAPHARRVALHVDTRQTLEDIGQVGVAKFIHFFPAVDLFGHLGAAAQVVVSRLAGHDLHPLKTRARRRGLRLARHILGQAGKYQRGRQSRHQGHAGKGKSEAIQGKLR